MNLTEYIKNVDDTDHAERKAAVFTFGRFNPMTKGHGLLIERVLKEAKDRDAEMFIFPSQTNDKTKDPRKNKNPLEWEEKIKFLEEAFPGITFVADESVKNPWGAVNYLSEKGYTDITIIAGSDRVEEYSTRLKQYALNHVENFDVVNCGTRDPDSSAPAGMSATAARDAALDGDIGKFRAATGWKGDFAERLMKAVRKGMGA